MIDVQELREMAYRGPGFDSHVRIDRGTLTALLDAVAASHGACWQINDYLEQRFGKSMETSPLGCFRVMAEKLSAFDFEEPE